MLTKVAVVGAGPVGLLGCLLLETFGLNYLCFEKADRLRSHPSAHWLSARSKQILSQITGLSQRIDAAQQDFSHFRYYRYCERVGGFEFGRTDHFLPSIGERLAVSRGYFGQTPNHISQSKFLSLEYEHLKDKTAVRFDQQIKAITPTNGLYHLTNQRGELVARAKYVVLTSGYHSPLREKAGIRMEGGREFYRLVNIHFRSKKLGGEIRRQGCGAMLYFVYNGVVPCVLVNHSLEQGEFVLQVPNYEPFVDLLSVYTAEELLRTAFALELYAVLRQDLVVVHVGRWKLQAQLSNAMYSGNLFIAGDTAHTYTPAGGFGMNCGLQDINQLVHGLHMVQRNSGVDVAAVAEAYNRERLVVNGRYLEKSLSNYGVTEETASELGFPSGLTDYFYRVCRMMPMGNLPLGMQFAEKLRLVAMGQLYKRRRIEPKLELFFDQFDARVQPLSEYFPQILESIRKRQIYDLWVDPSVTVEKLDSLYGRLDPLSICRTALPPGEGIVRRDGLILSPR